VYFTTLISVNNIAGHPICLLAITGFLASCDNLQTIMRQRTTGALRTYGCF